MSVWSFGPLVVGFIVEIQIVVGFSMLASISLETVTVFGLSLTHTDHDHLNLLVGLFRTKRIWKSLD